MCGVQGASVQHESVCFLRLRCQGEDTEQHTLLCQGLISQSAIENHLPFASKLRGAHLHRMHLKLRFSLSL